MEDIIRVYHIRRPKNRVKAALAAVDAFCQYSVITISHNHRNRIVPQQDNAAQIRLLRIISFVSLSRDTHKTSVTRWYFITHRPGYGQTDPWRS